MKYILGLIALGALFAAINQVHANEDTARIDCRKIATEALGVANDISCDKLEGSEKEKCLEVKKSSKVRQERAS